MKKIYLILALGFFTCSSYFAHAHHSFAATFAAGEKITIEGVVTNWSFKNPHVLVTVAVENPDGSTTEWVSEGAAATNMRRLGWSADTFSEGDLIRVTGDRTHDGSPMTSIDLVEFLDANGNVVKTMNESEAEIAGGNADGAPAGRPNNLSEKAAPMDLTLADGTTPNLTGAWTRHGMGFGPPQRPTATYTEAGEKAQALFTEVVDPQVFCDNPGLLRQAGMTPHPVRITQYDDRVEFAWEEYGGSRTVYFDERDFKGYRTHLGDGIARYEDGKLIIETHNLLTDPGSPEGDLTSHNVTFTEIYEREDSEQFGPAIRITGIAVDPDWLDGEMVYSGIKMSAGEYEFIENDCQTPLRERVAVHASMSHFVTSTPVATSAPLTLDAADAHCEALASELNAGGKAWKAYLSTSDVAAIDRIGQGPWYNARGEVIASGVDALPADLVSLGSELLRTERADAAALDQIGVVLGDLADDSLFHCFASIDDTTAVDVDTIIPAPSADDVSSDQGAAAPSAATPPAAAQPAPAAEPAVAEDTQGGIPVALIVAIVLGLAIVGFVLFRKKA